MMSVFEVTTRISPKWLERKTKHELASIIFANIDRIDLFASASNSECDQSVLSAAAPQMYEALKAYEALEDQRMYCEECEDQLERAPETCGECFPFAYDARCKIRAVIAKVEGK